MKRILSPGRNCQGIYPATKTGLLIDGRDYYRAFYHAARKARRYILISGWQFDSSVSLLRGADANREREGPGLLQFLYDLIAGNPQLQICILAWDFSVLFALEREWFQDKIFNAWVKESRLLFRFDSAHAVGASQHQKFVVIDGIAAFVGGMDICASRWDDRRHSPRNPFRHNPEGKPYGPETLWSIS
jgi:phospholipase D1/2